MQKELTLGEKKIDFQSLDFFESELCMNIGKQVTNLLFLFSLM